MSSYNVRGGGFNRVPQAPNTQNHELQNRNPFTAIIKSVSWETSEAFAGTPVPFKIVLSKTPVIKVANIEVVFESDFGQMAFDRPPAVSLTAMTVKGIWQSRSPANFDPAHGVFKLRVRVDNDTILSNALKLKEHAAAKAARINRTDGFDR